MHSGIVSPPGIWWKPAGRQEKIWVTIALVWCLIMFAMMPLWHLRGGQNPTGVRSKVEPAAFVARVNRFVDEYKVGEEQGLPVVAPPPGGHVYLLARMWQWYPVLKLQKGVTYTFHVSSSDLNHGFSLNPVNINLQIVPGYDYALKMTPTEAGDLRIICNEFCGIGHHIMIGKVLVTDGASSAGAAPDAPAPNVLTAEVRHD
jgi:cytochrome c oxidase subunit 2